jgi:hypothetical protein
MAEFSGCRCGGCRLAGFQSFRRNVVVSMEQAQPLSAYPAVLSLISAAAELAEEPLWLSVGL